MVAEGQGDLELVSLEAPWQATTGRSSNPTTVSISVVHVVQNVVVVVVRMVAVAVGSAAPVGGVWKSAGGFTRYDH